MTYTFDQIVELAQRSGIPNTPGSKLRTGDAARVKYTGGLSLHGVGQAVDFTGYDQDQLAEFFMTMPTAELYHRSRKTGKWYGFKNGKPVPESTYGGQLAKDHENHLHVAMKPEQVGPGSFLDKLRKGLASITTSLTPGLGALGSVIPNPGNVTDALGNMGSGIYSIAQSAVSVGQMASTITQLFLPTKLMRGALFLFGVVFMLIGIWFLSREIKESTA